MKKIAPITLLTAPVAFSLMGAGPAHAQRVKPFSLEAGISNLTDDAARNTTDGLGLHLSAHYRLPTRSLLAPRSGHPRLDLDFDNNTGKGHHVQLLGLSYGEQIPLGNQRHGILPYAGLGVGFAVTDVSVSLAGSSRLARRFHRAGSNPGGSTPTGGGVAAGTGTLFQSSKRVQFVGKLLLGVELSESIYVEASYIFGGSALGVKSDSLNFALGFHF
jgi:hypothetical protein